MKKIGITLLLTQLVFSVAFAQTEKGRWQVGAQVGNFTYQKSNNNGTRSFSGSLTPSAGYFIAKNLLTGVTVPLAIDETNSKYGLDYSSRTIGIGPFIRYYVGNSSFKPFIGIGYTYTRTYGKWKDITPLEPDATTKGYTDNLAPNAGVAYFINRNAVLQAGLSYNIQHREGKTTYPAPVNVVTNSYSENFKTLSLGIGFALLFGE